MTTRAEAAQAEADRLKAGAAMTYAEGEHGARPTSDADLLSLASGSTPERIFANAGDIYSRRRSHAPSAGSADNGAGTSPAIGRDTDQQESRPVERASSQITAARGNCSKTGEDNMAVPRAPPSRRRHQCTLDASR